MQESSSRMLDRTRARDAAWGHRRLRGGRPGVGLGRWLVAPALTLGIAASAGASPSARPTQGSAAPQSSVAPPQGSAVAAHGSAPPVDVLDALGADEPAVVARAVAELVALPAERSDPDRLFAAGRACEDKLLDPARALAIYARIIAEHPSARVASAAARRVAVLRALVGPGGESAGRAGELAQLIAHADAEPAAEVVRRANQLAAAAWPGAPDAALWLADWLRRSGRLAEAQAHYDEVTARWPASPQAAAALRGGASCALEARDWPLAEALAARLGPDDQAVRDDLLAAAARGRRRDHWYLAAWLAIAGAFAGLAASLVDAARRRPAGSVGAALRPPLEVLYLGPVAVVLVGVAITAHRTIAPAVAMISGGGIGLAWLSGAALELLHAGGRARRLRTAAHVAACLAGVAGLAYVALTRGGLLDQLIETVRFGPET